MPNLTLIHPKYWILKADSQIALEFLSLESLYGIISN